MARMISAAFCTGVAYTKFSAYMNLQSLASTTGRSSSISFTHALYISLFGTGAQFYLINVVSDYAGAVMPDMAGMALPALSEEEVLELQKDEFNEAVEPLRPLFAKAAVATKEICLVGNAGDEIAAFAKKKKLDLVVMGSHGYGRFKAAVMGSTATRIAATGDVPLLIIRQA